ncbi:class II aldolase/adducin family protein [Agrobacterium sp. LAD9]|uniref:class II aldolase/adducin family protein n=1 Tax=Agrobacterium sp. LAD9 TaxID=2055153 RepID=UPI000D1D9F30|nr:class II aldolase/adducin family protein [Agrobacterium sp. LAD9]
MLANNQPLTQADISDDEWKLRCDLAAIFRVFSRFQWNEHIGNHISLMLPGEGEPTFLINPRGYLFQELKASDFIVCDLKGNVLRGAGELRLVAFNIHVPIHMKHPDAKCVIHLHSPYLTAMAMTQSEISLSHHLNLLLNDRIVYDSAGDAPAHHSDEGERIASLLGPGKTTMVMRGHGVTVVGPTIEDAFDECYIAERTTMYQVLALSTGRPLHVLPDSARRNWHGPWGDKLDARLHLNAWRRILDKEEPDYAS